MKRHVVFSICAILLLTVASAPAQTLDGLKPGHPRLLADAEDFAQIAQRVRTDPLAKAWHEELARDAEAMLAAPVTRHHLRDGRRLLYESRDVKKRVLTLGLLHQIDPDPRYVQRVWADLEAAAGFPDWNPDHFLDVAEMAFAFAIAYDWLYDAWSAEQRDTIRAAIIKHGIEPGLLDYERNTKWTRTTINWNQVCNGGLIVASLAIADESPELTSRMIDLAVKALPISMARYAPEGGYDEGPAYWDYGTSYNVFAIAALESALGHSFGLADREGFAITGRFPIQMAGPTGDVFNFADGKERRLQSPLLFYFADRFGDADCARFAAEHNDGSPLDLLWYRPAVLIERERGLPLAALYEKVGVAAIRSAWDDPSAMFLAVKAGPMPDGHAHLDLGSFIYEHQGIRWFIDLGGDDYNLPGFFDQREDGKRWQYYRIRAEGHNTLVVNPGQARDQRADATAPIQLNDQTITIDLSEAYGIPAQRQIVFKPEEQAVELTDTLAADAPAQVWWFAHTRAAIEVAEDGQSAVLEQDGRQIRVALVSPARARFQVMEAKPLPGSPDPAGQNPNDGSEKLNRSEGSSFVQRGEIARYGEPNPARAVRKLAVHLADVENTTLTVRIGPVTD